MKTKEQILAYKTAWRRKRSLDPEWRAKQAATALRSYHRRMADTDYRQAHNDKNRDRKLAWERNKYRTNPVWRTKRLARQTKEKSAILRANNRDAIRAQNRAWFQAQPRSYKREKQNRWRANNRDKRNALEASWRARNPEAVKTSKKAFHARHRERPAYRLAINLRSRLRLALKNNAKRTSVLALICCSLDELRTHLETQFQPSMTWDNYGKWHIDHRIALATIDPAVDREEWNKLWHFSNLQPLWAIDNARKGVK